MGALAAGCAGRGGGNVVLPEKRGPSTSREALKGRDRGDVEISLGAVTTAVAVTLIVLGSFSARHAAYVRQRCGSPDAISELPTPEYEATCTDPTGFDPFVAATVSSALAFAIAVPIAVGSGFLLRKGVGMRRDFFAKKRADGKLTLRPWLDGRGAGLGVSLRF